MTVPPPELEPPPEVLEPPDEAPPDAELLELLFELEPHAATPRAATAVTASAPIRRVGTVVLLAFIGADPSVSAAQRPVLPGCETGVFVVWGSAASR